MGNSTPFLAINIGLHPVVDSGKHALQHVAHEINRMFHELCEFAFAHLSSSMALVRTLIFNFVSGAKKVKCLFRGVGNKTSDVFHSGHDFVFYPAGKLAETFDRAPE